VIVPRVPPTRGAIFLTELQRCVERPSEFARPEIGDDFGEQGRPDRFGRARGCEQRTRVSAAGQPGRYG
jgi:hypothetical protein